MSTEIDSYLFEDEQICTNWKKAYRDHSEAGGMHISAPCNPIVQQRT